MASELAQHLDAVLPGHLVIADDDVEALLLQTLDGLDAVGLRHHLDVPAVLQDLLDEVQHRFLVVNEDDLGWHDRSYLIALRALQIINGACLDTIFDKQVWN